MKKLIVVLIIFNLHVLSAHAGPFGWFEKKKIYVVKGLDQDEETKTYIESIIKDRLSQDIDVKDEQEKQEIIAYSERLAIDDLRRGLQAKGYYHAIVTYQDGKGKGIYRVESGEKTLIKSIKTLPEKYSEYLENLDLRAEKALVAQDVLTAQSKLYDLLQKDSCAYQLDVQHKVIADNDLRNADVEFHIEQGKPASFGPVEFSFDDHESGLVKESYLKKLVPWKEGECFRHQKIDDLRSKILASGLFSRADVVFPDDAEEGGAIPVEIVLHPKAQRSVRAGVSYYTDEGVGVALGWEHRNFLGGAEKLNADLGLSVLEQRLDLKLATPFFLRKDQNLALNIFTTREDTDAYEQLGTGGGFQIKRTLNKRLSATVGADIELTRIKEEDGREETFGLLSPLASLLYDSRDDTLDPKKGWLLSLRTEPFIDALGESAPFIRSIFRGQTYYAVHKKVTLAARMALGAITGEQSDDIPATKRFFAGGGGSVRGFGFQEIGPQENNDPIGGRSLVELSGEGRFKITNKIGAVAFVDAGDVDENTMPRFNDLSVGAGVGLRYYTDFGPLRFDVGVPLNKKDNLDENFQIYISIGQAF
ncbi:MAG: BamA/TamA family outer membrane protein [Alphaproteobacteria bacterium]|nr:BamA/TamA family outer membrane protein [Alphaproteobacteria bacterium]